MEHEIVINGTRLTDGQAMMVRVAVMVFHPNCGGGEFGPEMTRAYNERRREVLELLHKAEART